MSGLAAVASVTPARGAPRLRVGANVVQTPSAPLGGEAAARSFRGLRSLGVEHCALVVFLWQRNAADPGVTLGSDMSLDGLKAGIRQAREAGLGVLVKPHVWVPGGWAGQVEMTSEAGWKSWFEGYGRGVADLAQVAATAEADGFCVGVELRATTHRSEWRLLIERVRKTFKGPLTYCAHGADEVEAVPFWPLLDSVGASLYPALGDDRALDAWRSVMTNEARRVKGIADRYGKPAAALEIGLRSAAGAAARPWESAEERAAPADEQVQAEVLSAWLETLAAETFAEAHVWRWFSDPAAGGPQDTDFTIQGKQAERMLAERLR